MGGFTGTRRAGPREYGRQAARSWRDWSGGHRRRAAIAQKSRWESILSSVGSGLCFLDNDDWTWRPSLRSAFADQVWRRGASWTRAVQGPTRCTDVNFIDLLPKEHVETSQGGVDEWFQRVRSRPDPPVQPCFAIRRLQNLLSHRRYAGRQLLSWAPKLRVLDGAIAVVDSPQAVVRTIGWISRFLVYGGGPRVFHLDACRIAAQRLPGREGTMRHHDGRENFSTARY
jgi:hypothetical protein